MHTQGEVTCDFNAFNTIHLSALAGSDAAQQLIACSSRSNFHPMQNASTQVALFCV
jgi:hypothetical protein